MCGAQCCHPLAPFSSLLALASFLDLAALAKLEALQMNPIIVVLRSDQPLQEVVKARNPGASSLTWIQFSLLQIQAELNQLDEALVKELNLLLDLLPHLLDQGPVVLLQIQVDLDHMVDALAPGSSS